MAPQAPVQFILGTHMVGDSSKSPIAFFDDKKDVQALLDAFYSRGFTQLDTAQNYSPHAPGSSEIRLGQVGAPSRFTIHTKVTSGTPGDHEAAKIHRSIQSSLDSLKVSSVETMFLHVPDRQTPFEETVKAMNEAFQQGKFKRFGVSNYTAPEVEKILQICEEHGYVKPSVYEGHYNAIVRLGESKLFPLLRKNNISFFAYSPAAAGLFTGNIATSTRWRTDNVPGKLYSMGYDHPPIHAAVAAAGEVAGKHGISAHEAAVRWVAYHSILDGQYGDAVIIGASKLEQVPKTLDAVAAGPLPAEVADAFTGIYASLGGIEIPYHL